jgi:hypothetical protein
MAAVAVRKGRVVSLTAVVVIIWLLIGAVAAAQRHPYTGGIAGCSRVASTVATIAVGPLNYVGTNPEIACQMPKPSK